jgi:hypothetical protein
MNQEIGRFTLRRPQGQARPGTPMPDVSPEMFAQIKKMMGAATAHPQAYGNGKPVDTDARG